MSNTVKKSRIQQRNRTAILEAALDVFCLHGFRGSTLDQIADACDLSKPNLIYYYKNKEAIYEALLATLLDDWLSPLEKIDENGEPVEEILKYANVKLDIARDLPRQSRLFANEILGGAPVMEPHLKGRLKTIVDEKTALIQRWIDEGKIANIDPYHLIVSIWALTQHYADFDTQIKATHGKNDAEVIETARKFQQRLFRLTITP